MAMKRYFFTSEDLGDLERFQEELEQSGIATPQIHVLTLDDTGADNHQHLHAVTSLMKKDIIHSGVIGAIIGGCMAALVVGVAHLAGWDDTPAGWMPFLFLAVIVFGFFTWEGGLWGIQNPNVHFKQFQSLLEGGKHVFFVDVDPEQGAGVNKLLEKHPSIRKAGKARGAPRWIIAGQNRFKKIVVESLP